MSRVGKNTVASVATIMCIVFMLSIALPLSGAQSTNSPDTHVTVSNPYNSQTGWYTYDASGTWVTLTVYNGSGTVHTYYKLDNNTTYTTYTSSFPLADGIHTLYYYSADDAGTELPKSTVIKVDNVLPVINLTINGNKNSTTGYYNGTNTVNLTAYDNGSGLKYPLSYSFDNTITWTNYTSNITNLPDGSHTLYYRSYDVAGNVNISSTQINIFNPPVSVDQIINQWYPENVILTFSYDISEVNHIDYTYDKDINNIKTWYHSYPGGASIALLTEGNHSIHYRAVGANGISDLRFMWFGIDKYPPTIGISIEGSQSSNGWYNGDIRVHINAKDSSNSISHTEYSWNNNDWYNYDGPFEVKWGKSRTIWYRTTDMMDRTVDGSTWIYFAPGSYNQGSMSDSVWINGVLYGPSTGASPSDSEPEPTLTPTDVPWPTPTQVPSPTPATETTTGSNNLLALAVLIGVMAIVIVAAAAAYFFVLKPK